MPDRRLVASYRHLLNTYTPSFLLAPISIINPAHERDVTVPRFFQTRPSKARLGPLHGVRLGRLVSLRAKIGRCRATLGEEAGEDWLDEGTEDNLSATIVSHEPRVPNSDMVATALTQFAEEPSTRRGRI